ncbi:MAG: hypothetical protein H6737_11065 [Alphaproteobacteria bacterium]|nr:hypothetical protein [Alphaproteobacteria bacterium]
MSTNESADVYEKMKTFVGFTDQDAANLKKLGPVFEKHGPALTDGFYTTLEQFPETAQIIAGRVDSLKATHGRWMGELFGGEYGMPYFDSRMRIGMVHVKVGIAPYFVEGVMDVIRTGGLAAIFTELDDRQEAIDCSGSLLKILDLDLLVINLAYGEERLDRLTAFTGFSRRLIENCIKQAKKK